MRLAAVCCLLAIGVACSRSDRPVLVDLSGKENLSFFKLGTVGGTRDGDRLSAQVLITDSASMLTLNLDFRIGTPTTTLENGRWRWLRNGRVEEGRVEARAVTFLGGQNGPPSIGGTFDLIGNAGSPQYRVNLPVTPLGR
jgi:hypothetical protein